MVISLLSEGNYRKISKKETSKKNKEIYEPKKTN